MTAHIVWDRVADCSRLVVLRRQRSCLQNCCGVPVKKKSPRRGSVKVRNMEKSLERVIFRGLSTTSITSRVEVVVQSLPRKHLFRYFTKDILSYRSVKLVTSLNVYQRFSFNSTKLSVNFLRRTFKQDFRLTSRRLRQVLRMMWVGVLAFCVSSPLVMAQDDTYVH